MPESLVIPQLIMSLESDTNAFETAAQKDLTTSSLPESPSALEASRPPRDSSWLQVEVCRDFQKNTCPRGDFCRFAHPEASIVGKDGRVTCCYDFLKDRCWRDYCKYYHPPAHIKDRLISAGKMFGAMMSNSSKGAPFQPAGPERPGPEVFSPSYGSGPEVFSPNYGSGPEVFSPNYGSGVFGDTLDVCPEFCAGHCPNPSCPLAHPGPHVNYNHDNMVTICNSFLRNACMRGDRCRFYHPSLSYPPPPQSFYMGFPLKQAFPITQPQLMPVMSPLYPMLQPSIPSVFIPSSPYSFVPNISVVPMVPPFLNTSGPGHIPHQQVVANIAPVSIINSTEETEGEITND